MVVHTIGFTKEHDYAFLDLLRRAGTEDGFFRYAERSAEGGSLAEKFADLFNWFQTSNQKIKVCMYEDEIIKLMMISWHILYLTPKLPECLVHSIKTNTYIWML